MKRRDNRRTRDANDKILIVCGKTKTEKQYFESFKEEIKNAGIATIDLKIEDKGNDPRDILNIAIKHNRQNKYLETWIVIDKDEYEIDNVIIDAKKERIKVAWSNECFEVWFLFHFIKSIGGGNRVGYYRKLERYLGVKDYSRNKGGTQYYNKLKDMMDDAIINAENSHLSHERDNKKPSEAKPCTTVYILVRYLRGMI